MSEFCDICKKTQSDAKFETVCDSCNTKCGMYSAVIPQAHQRPRVFCEYCPSRATVYLRFSEPYLANSGRQVKVIHVCSLHCVQVIIKEQTNVVNVGGI